MPDEITNELRGFFNSRSDGSIDLDQFKEEMKNNSSGIRPN